MTEGYSTFTQLLAAATSRIMGAAKNSMRAGSIGATNVAVKVRSPSVAATGCSFDWAKGSTRAVRVGSCGRFKIKSWMDPFESDTR